MIRRIAALLLLGFASTAAFGHAGHDHAFGFEAGFSHPFLGLDHLLAMVALGVWAAQARGRSIALAPALFVLSMLAGALYALNGGALPFVEHGIALSVIAIGLLVAFVPAKGAVAALAAPVIALGAAMHGYAHGAEIPPQADAAAYIAGFIVATAALHAAGVFLGLELRPHLNFRRATGLLVALGGSALAFI